jgi:hypothetical protein
MKKLVKYIFIVVTVLQLSSAKAQVNNIKFIRQISVVTDCTFNDVIGINVTYKYNFLPLEELAHDDSILNKASFKIITRLD